MRVLRVLTRGNLGGPMRQAVALWQQDDRVGLQTLIAVGACAPDEVELAWDGVPEPVQVDPAARGLVRLARLGRAARPLRDFGAAGELRALIRRFRPDVVHTHTSQAGYFGRRAARAERVAVVAHTFHGHVLADYYPRPVTAVLRRLEARAARHTDLLFAVSPSCRDEVHGFGIGGGRLRVLPPAVELQGFGAADRSAARRLLGLDAADFAVGFVGRLVPVKRPELFVELLALLPGVRGLVFGAGPLRATLAGASRVEWFGAEQHLPSRLAGLDALVLCSRREGCPLVALEAFAAGVPVVGLDVPGVRDVLTTWGAGLLVPATAGVAGLADAVQRLRREPGLGAALVAAARAGLQRFQPAAVASALQEQYARVRDARQVPTAR